MKRKTIHTSLKLSYYVVLILYHLLDVGIDWNNLHDLLTVDTSSGVPSNRLAVKILHASSCAIGTVSMGFLMRVYAHYIRYHHISLFATAQEDNNPESAVERSATIQISDDEDNEETSLIVNDRESTIDRESAVERSASMQTSDDDDNEEISLIVNEKENTIHPKHTLVELVISAIELTLKDSIQTGLLFSNSYTFKSTLTWQSMTFSFCSLFAHFKLFISFMTKLFRLGEGEDADEGFIRRDVKFIVCLLGCIGSAVFEGLMIAYLVKASWA